MVKKSYRHGGTDSGRYFRYPGQYFDGESGLHYNWWRYYEPETGRYTREDPLGFWGGQANFYSYAQSNPIYAIDPEGLVSIFEYLPKYPDGYDNRRYPKPAWPIEPPYCPFFQIAVWTNCTLECAESGSRFEKSPCGKDNNYQDCVLDCVTWYYDGYDENPMDPFSDSDNPFNWTR